MMLVAAAALLLPSAVLAAPVGDRVKSIPGITAFPTDWAVYSGCAYPLRCRCRGAGCSRWRRAAGAVPLAPCRCCL